MDFPERIYTILNWTEPDAEMKGPPGGAQSYQRFPLSKPVIIQSIDLHGACLQGFYLPSFCLPGSFNFIFSEVLQSAMVECVLNGES